MAMTLLRDKFCNRIRTNRLTDIRIPTSIVFQYLRRYLIYSLELIISKDVFLRLDI